MENEAIKACIIENDWEVPEDLEDFIKARPDLVGTDPYVFLNARQRGVGGIEKFNTVILYSTFVYKGQLESLMAAFHAQKFGPQPYTFYVMGILSKLEEWTEKSKHGEGYSMMAGWGFENHEQFIYQLSDMLLTERMVLYDAARSLTHFIDKTTGEKSTDESEFENLDPQYEYQVFRIRYDENRKSFYHEQPQQ